MSGADQLGSEQLAEPQELIDSAGRTHENER
jgi:hypothetical protein